MRRRKKIFSHLAEFWTCLVPHSSLLGYGVAPTVGQRESHAELREALSALLWGLIKQGCADELGFCSERGARLDDLLVLLCAAEPQLPGNLLYCAGLNHWRTRLSRRTLVTVSKSRCSDVYALRNGSTMRRTASSSKRGGAPIH